MNAPVGALRVTLGADTAQYEAGMRRAAESARRSGQDITRSLQAATRSSGQMRAGMQQLSFQIGDIAQQFSLGVPPMRIFAQQSGQVVQALQVMGGQGNAFLRFLGGPWGIGLAAATVVLLPLIGKLFDTKTELEKATDALAENERRAELTRRAQEAFGRTLPGITAAIREETEQLERQNRSLAQNQELMLQRAQGNVLDLDRRRRDNLEAQADVLGEIADAEQRVVRARGNPELHRQELARLNSLRARLGELRQENAQIQSSLAEANREVRLAQIPIAVREAEALVDPLQRINDQYDAMADAARSAAEGNERLARSLTQTLAGIERQRRAALEAQRETQRADRSAVRPATGAVLSQFGANRSGVPINGRRVPGRRHQGVDIRGNIGDPVVAPEGGTAFVRNAPGGLGLYVEIRADSGARDLLAHLSRANIQSGQRVEAGQLVGLIGNSGNARGADTHLHWQRMVNGRWVDPMRSVGSGGAAQAAQAAQREAEQRAQYEAAFNDELRQLGEALIEARARGVQSEEERFRLGQDELEAARERQNASYEEAERRGRLTEAQRILLVAKNDEVYLQLRLNAQLDEWRRLEDQRFQIASEDLRDAMQIEQMRSQFARTIAQRRDAEMRLLDMALQEELRAIERARLQEGINDAERARLDRAEAAARERHSLGQQSVLQRNMSPLQALLAGIPATAEEVNEAFENIAANGISSLVDGIAEAISGARSLADVFKQVAKSIIADLVRIAIQRAIIGPLVNALGGLIPGGSGLASAVGASFGGAGSGASGLLAGIPRFATGGSFTVGGHPGVDRNILSLNGSPVAKVSHGETVDVGTGRRGGVVEIRLRDDMLDARIEEGAGVVITRVYPAMRADTAGFIRQGRRRQA